MLGSNTRTYRSYGKRSYHTTNKSSRAFIDLDDFPEPNNTNNNKAILILSSSSSAASEASDSEPEAPAEDNDELVASLTAALPVITLSSDSSDSEPDEPILRRPAKPSPVKRTRNLRATRSSNSNLISELDKENRKDSAASSSRDDRLGGALLTATARFSKGRAKLLVNSPAAKVQTKGKEAAAEVFRSPLKPRGRRRALEVDAPPPPLALPRTTRKTSRRASSPIVTESPPLFSTVDTGLAPLLALTAQKHPIQFADFLFSPPAPLHPTDPQWSKVGAASYSEVFSARGQDGEALVCKFLPLFLGAEGEDGEGWPERSTVETVVREFEISKMLGEGKGKVEGFVEFRKCFVVQGAYPPALMELWDSFLDALPAHKKDEEISPAVFPSSQTYAVLVLPYAGEELETCRLKTWREAMSVLVQVGEALAKAEENLDFEHRDLHWGNVLIAPFVPSAPTPQKAKAKTARRAPPPTSAIARLGTFSLLDASQVLYSPEAAGVVATIIDFTLSRARKEGKEKGVWSGGLDDDCLFEGEGDYQHDIYRMMKAQTESDWEIFEPLTNLMWLHYLSLKLLHEKGLRSPLLLPSKLAPPSAKKVKPVSRIANLVVDSPRRVCPSSPARPKATTSADLASRAIEKVAYARLKECEKMLKESLDVKGKSKGRQRWKSAGDFVAWFRSAGAVAS